MIDPTRARERAQTASEEIANSVSHGVGLLGAAAAAPVLVVAAVGRGDAAEIVGASVFAASLVGLYLASTIYHALPASKIKRVFRALDHAAIFLLIAGTYTPFTLGVLRGGWGWTLLGLVWSLATVGIVLTASVGFHKSRFSTWLYLGMGWLAVIALRPLAEHLSSWGLFWLAAGGLAYTLGVWFFRSDHLPYRHFVWHLFVLAGSACHLIAVLFHAV